MAEEKFYIGKQIPNPCQKCRKEVCENGCNKYNKYYYDFQKSKTYLYSRTEAIEKMAKAIHYYEWAHDKHFPKWDELNCDIQNDYKNMAEAALNALLGESK